MTQNYDTTCSTEYDISITNLKIVTALLAAIWISETFYWGLQIKFLEAFIDTKTPTKDT